LGRDSSLLRFHLRALAALFPADAVTGYFFSARFFLASATGVLAACFAAIWISSAHPRAAAVEASPAKGNNPPNMRWLAGATRTTSGAVPCRSTAAKLTAVASNIAHMRSVPRNPALTSGDLSGVTSMKQIGPPPFQWTLQVSDCVSTTVPPTKSIASLRRASPRRPSGWQQGRAVQTAPESGHPSACLRWPQRIFHGGPQTASRAIGILPSLS
jgi:hypothetical protein